MEQINFWNETATLYVNGLPCAKRKARLLARGIQENVRKLYKRSTESCADEETERTVREVMAGIFDLAYDVTLLTGRNFYTRNPFYDRTTKEWDRIVGRRGRLYTKDIDTVMVKLEYTACPDQVSMKDLFDYPADLVIDYLKERGITTCPFPVK